MKKALLILMMVAVCVVITGSVQAQCVAEIKKVEQDPDRGSIIVETEYTLNGKVVQTGRTRYNEESGTNEEIIARAKKDVETHCENLIRRIEANEIYRKSEMLKVQKSLTQPIIDAIKDDLVGHKVTKTEAEDTFKGKTIKVTYDEKNTVSTAIVESK